MNVRIPGQGAVVNVQTIIERQLRHWDNMAAVLRKQAPGKPLAEASCRPVITLSGPIGSGIERLAVALARELEYDIYGRELLDAVAADLNCQRLLLEGLDERVQSNLRTMFETLIHGREIENQEYLAALVRVVGSLAEKGGVIIIGRGSAFILGHRAALRILLEAPLEARVRRVMQSRQISEDEARRHIAAREQAQRKFCRYYFRRELSDPTAFDLTINTERLDPENAVALIRAALAARGVEISRPPRGPDKTPATESAVK